MNSSREVSQIEGYINIR